MTFSQMSLLAAGLVSFATAQSMSAAPQSNPFPATGPVVPGMRAALRGGKALAPAQAPLEVKRAIWAANQLI